MAASTRSAMGRSLLVVSELALSLLLLIGAGLLVRSFLHLLSVDPGFNSENLLTFRVSLPDTKYREPSELIAFQQQVLDRMRALPGVSSAGTVTPLPLSGGAMGVSFSIEGRPQPPAGQTPVARFRSASPDYFRAMQIPLRHGRYLRLADDAAAPRVVLISQAMARRYWPGQDPIGARLTLGEPSAGNWRTVVGIVADVKHQSLESESQPEMYLPFAQAPMGWMYFVLRTGNQSGTLLPQIRAGLKSVDAELPIFGVYTMNELLDRSLARRRFSFLLLATFALVALALAAMGVYGVVSSATAERTREIGIRMALGSQPGDIVRLIVGRGMWLSGIGAAIGLAGAFALTRVLASLLYGVNPTDPLTFAATTLLLLVVAVAACYIPARRATRVDPMTALRYE